MPKQLRHHILKLKRHNRLIDRCLDMFAYRIQLKDRFTSSAVHFVNSGHRLLNIAFRGQRKGHVLRRHLVDGLLGSLNCRLHLGQGATDLLTEMAGSPRQIPDFIGHHGKPSPGLACPCRLNGSIEGQQIGLFGNSLNLSEHPSYFAHLGDYSVRHFNKGHCQTRILDHTIHKLSKRFRCLVGEVVKLRNGPSFRTAGYDLHSKLLLPLNQGIHFLKATNQLTDGLAEYHLSTRHFIAHLTYLPGHLPGDMNYGFPTFFDHITVEMSGRSDALATHRRRTKHTPQQEPSNSEDKHGNGHCRRTCRRINYQQAPRDENG